VTTAYRWSPDHLAGLLRDAGMAEVARTLCEPRPGDRRQFQELQLLARKGWSSARQLGFGSRSYSRRDQT
jgi:hypothetical protein